MEVLPFNVSGQVRSTCEETRGAYPKLGVAKFCNREVVYRIVTINVCSAYRKVHGYAYNI